MHGKWNVDSSELTRHEQRKSPVLSAFLLPDVSRCGPNAYVHPSDINVSKTGVNNTKVRFVDSFKTTESTPTFFHF